VKVLALDHGAARTGVAVSDPTGTLVRPLRAIRKVDTTAGAAALDEVIAAEAPERIVVGDPRRLDGGAGGQSRVARRFAERLRARAGVPVDLYDERLTTAEAERRRRESGSRADADSLAACVLLEAYLSAAGRIAAR
jgi:putative Holliday junction resolvase